jgi:hypothetical protein
VAALIPWRPPADTSCANPSNWRAAVGNCYGAILAEVDFAFATGSVTLPDTLVFGIAFDTAHHGYAPLGVNGPYNSLNVVTAHQGAAELPVTAGAYVNPDVGYVNSSSSGFRADTGWTGYQPLFELYSTPEPGGRRQ